MTQQHNNQTTIRSPFLHALFDLAPRIGLTVRLVIPPVFRHRKTQWEEDQTRLNKDEFAHPSSKGFLIKDKRINIAEVDVNYADHLSI